VIGAEDVDENLVDNFKTEDCVDRLAHPEWKEVHVVVTCKPERENNRKIHDLSQEKSEEYGKLLMQLPPPKHYSHHQLNDWLGAPKIKRDVVVV
jgi:hypothetical protein